MIWEVSIDTSNRGLERLARALILTNAVLHKPRQFFGDTLGRGRTSVLLVELDDDRKDEFREIARPTRMLKPSRPSLAARTTTIYVVAQTNEPNLEDTLRAFTDKTRAIAYARKVTARLADEWGDKAEDRTAKYGSKEVPYRAEYNSEDEVFVKVCDLED